MSGTGSMSGVHLTYQQHECNSMRCAMCGRMNGAMPNSMSGATLQHEWRHKVRTLKNYKIFGNRDNKTSDNTLYRLHTAILNRPLSSAATKEV